MANYCGMKVIVISCISNAASSDNGDKLSHSDVIETTNKAKAKFKSLILKIIECL